METRDENCTDCKQRKKLKLAAYICHDTSSLVCTECMLSNYNTNSTEFIEDFKVRVKQTVWLINTKLDKSILKLRFLKSRLQIADCDTKE